MHMNDLLRAHGKLERQLRDMEAAAGKEAAPTEQCWPQWLVCLRKLNKPEVFHAWWEEHGKSCVACSRAVDLLEAGMRDARASGAAPAAVTKQVVINPRWPARLPAAAETPPDLGSPHQALPHIQYHSAPTLVAHSLDAVWFVSWDNRLFVVMTGSGAALAEWRSGAVLVDSEDGTTIGDLRPASGGYADFLAPGGRFDGREAACFLCDVGLAGLEGRSFTIPRLLSRGLRLVPLAERPEGIPELVGDLVFHNRPRRFLGGLPTVLADREQVLTVSAYIRLLHLRHRLLPAERAKLAELPWLPADLVEALKGSGRPSGE